MQLWEIVKESGWLIAPIILCSVVALAIIFERFLSFFMIRYKTVVVVPKVLTAVRKNNITQALDICERMPYYVTNVLKAGLLRVDESKETIKEAMENASFYEIPKLEHNLNFLATLAHISPLLGLLGTVIGMIECFDVVKRGSINVGMVNPTDLAGGISKALNTTAAGLCVAIPAYLAYNYFAHKVNSCVLEMEKSATELLEILSERSYSEV
ncbi:MAG: MotA/TolQ/ExbB proton channel family protein [Candidatus Omnitrophica bacterium]|nr:MotA/TolQ/ExbB proton channel family protein [Candidatus Omnitrophota bacterium]MDD5080608.1 MotA/TolQ/ExbB proton channel family protein [Candidatus Omnitrophota bacterium]MDD5441139.1 MotA/TolQ/ExbB proton channel family protein [Candidatus Omnitrophota bacterium]